MMPRRSTNSAAALLLVVASLAGLPVTQNAAAQTAGTRQAGRSTLVKAPNAGSLSPIGRLLIIVQPAGTLHSQVVEDALAAEMMAAGLTLVSREKSQSAELKLLEKAAAQEESAAQEKPEDKAAADEQSKEEDQEKEDVSLLGIAKAAGADVIVSVTVLTDVVQRNVFDERAGRVTQVRSEQVVLAVSCTVVRVSDGELLAAGCTDYAGTATTIVPAARHLGAALLKLLR